MYYPAVGDRVSMSGCVDEYIVVRADYSACVGDICLLADRAAIQESVPFRLLFEVIEFEYARSEAYSWESQLWVIRQLLRSSQAHVDKGRVLISDIQSSIFATLQAIHSSEELIDESDRLIARARTLDH
jgi:hypothetical protein